MDADRGDGHHGVHRQDPLPRAERRWPGSAEPEQADHPAALAAVGLEQLQHPFVGAPRLAGEGVADVVLEVEVADGDGVGIADPRPEHRADRPRADAAQQRQLRRALLGGQAAAHAQRSPAWRPRVRSASARLASMPSGWYHHAARSTSAAGSGGRRNVGSGPGAGSPRRRTTRCHGADRLARRHPLADDHRDQLVVQGAAGPEADVGMEVLGAHDRRVGVDEAVPAVVVAGDRRCGGGEPFAAGAPRRHGAGRPVTAASAGGWSPGRRA